MPLTTCPDCQREISGQAPACVHCGRPMPAAEPPKAKRPDLASLSPRFRIGGRLLFALVIVALYYCGKCAAR